MSIRTTSFCEVVKMQKVPEKNDRETLQHTFLLSSKGQSQWMLLAGFRTYGRDNDFIINLLTVASRACSTQCCSLKKGDGGRFHLPLRDSSGITPDSLCSNREQEHCASHEAHQQRLYERYKYPTYKRESNRIFTYRNHW